jgi:nicotinamide phosphoribosyltransferase
MNKTMDVFELEAIKMRALCDDFNIITATDSYKLTHPPMYPNGTQMVSSYFEARSGAKFDLNVFCTLQYLMLRYMSGQVVTKDKIDWAEYLAELHFGQKGIFFREGWEYILNKYDGRLPLEICAVAEGTPVPTGNVMLQTHNTDPILTWFLTNTMESFLTHVWSGTTGSSLSRYVKLMQKKYLDISCDTPDAVLPFMLHDFGYRGSSSDESARQVGLGHLINYLGTDTVPALEMAIKYYNGNIRRDQYNVGFSVNATEHSIMTSRGEEGEFDVVDELLDKYPNGILSIVIDSYNDIRFIETMGTPRFKDRILNRNGQVVFRPDSGPPVETSERVYKKTADVFGFYVNKKGYEVLNPKVGNLWGDGINEIEGEDIYKNFVSKKISAENDILGMGGNLHQKINRDTQRNAFKSSYQVRNGVGKDIFKNPIDGSKKSKKGRLALIKDENGDFKTLQGVNGPVAGDLLIPVFRNGEVLVTYSLDDMRKNAAI